MGRFFDIRPPKPKATAPAPQKRRQKNGWGWFLFVFLIIIIIVFVMQLSGSKVTSDNKTSQTQTPSQNNFELFNDSGQSNLTQEKVLTVRILNASGEDEPVEKAKKILTDAGFKIEQLGKSENLYEQTIIYYKKDHLSDGDRTNNALKAAFQTKLQESENLGSTYDVLVIVGKK